MKSRWAARLLNLALLALGLVMMALLYALVTKNFASPASAQKSTPASQTGDIIQVGVRNGCGRAGLAARARNFLVRHHFDVVEVGNYTTFDQDTSLVIDRVGNLQVAQKVAAAVGIPKTRVRQDLRPNRYLDASIIIGEDYKTLRPFAEKKIAE